MKIDHKLVHDAHLADAQEHVKKGTANSGHYAFLASHHAETAKKCKKQASAYSKQARELKHDGNQNHPNYGHAIANRNMYKSFAGDHEHLASKYSALSHAGKE